MEEISLAQQFIDAVNKEMEKYMLYCEENGLDPEAPIISSTHVSAKDYLRLQKWMNDFNNRKDGQND